MVAVVVAVRSAGSGSACSAVDARSARRDSNSPIRAARLASSLLQLLRPGLEHLHALSGARALGAQSVELRKLHVRGFELVARSGESGNRSLVLLLE